MHGRPDVFFSVGNPPSTFLVYFDFIWRLFTRICNKPYSNTTAVVVSQTRKTSGKIETAAKKRVQGYTDMKRNVE